MTFSKFRYVIASLLLVGASSLLVSCASVTDPISKESQPPSTEIETISFGGCEIEEVKKDSSTLVVDKKRHKNTEKAPIEPDAGCITS